MKKSIMAWLLLGQTVWFAGCKDSATDYPIYRGTASALKNGSLWGVESVATSHEHQSDYYSLYIQKRQGNAVEEFLFIAITTFELGRFTLEDANAPGAKAFATYFNTGCYAHPVREYQLIESDSCYIEITTANPKTMEFGGRFRATYASDTSSQFGTPDTIRITNGEFLTKVTAWPDGVYID